MKQGVDTLITLSFLISLILMAAAIIFCGPLLHLLNCSEKAFSQARNSMIITAIEYPFILGYYVVVGALHGMGRIQASPLFHLCGTSDKYCRL